MRRVAILAVIMAMSAAVEPAIAAEPTDAVLKAGERVFYKCRSCHTIDKDGSDNVGPNLWGIFGSKAGSKPDFAYSDTLLNSNIVWSEETIDQWLAKPTTFLPGTIMAFIGVPKEEDRKAVLAYLKKKSTEE